MKNAKQLVERIEHLLSRLAGLKSDIGLETKGTQISIERVIQMSVPMVLLPTFMYFQPAQYTA